MRVVIVLLVVTSFSCRKEDLVHEEKVDASILLELVNQFRAEGCLCGDRYMPAVGILEWSSDLEWVAQLHSKDMNRHKFFDHEGSNGQTPGQRVQASHFSGIYGGENIAKGYSDEVAVFYGWIDSPRHCVNIMRPDNTHMAVGRSGIYWTQLFGKKK